MNKKVSKKKVSKKKAKKVEPTKLVFEHVPAPEERRISVSLTEREWDHVLIAVETSVASVAKSNTILEEAMLPVVAGNRCQARFELLAEDIAEQLGWDSQTVSQDVRDGIWQLVKDRAIAEQNG